jgi:hypothetical protein
MALRGSFSDLDGIDLASMVKVLFPEIKAPDIPLP